MFSTDLIPFAWSFGRVLAESWAGQLRWVKIGWYELSSARREGRRGRSLCVTNFPPVKPHLRPSSTLRTPTVIPNNKDHPPCHHHPHPQYDWITSFLSKTLTCCLWAKGWGWNSMLFFSVHFFISLFLVKFTALWSFKIFVLFYFWSSCLFVSPNNISRAAVPRPSSLISDYSSNLCKLKPCQMELRGLRVSYLIHIANIFWFKEKGEKNKSVSKQCNQYLFHFKSIQWTVFSKVQHICTWKSSQIFGTFPSQVWSGSKWPHSQETLLSSFTTGHW